MECTTYDESKPNVAGYRNSLLRKTESEERRIESSEEGGRVYYEVECRFED